MPVPHVNEAVVYGNFFLLNFCVPTRKFVVSLLEIYETQLHNQTPNSIINISKFMWVCRTFEVKPDVDCFGAYYVMWVCQTFGVEPDVDCFGAYFELHNQGLKLVTMDGDEVKDAQYARCNFIPCQALGHHEKVCLSFAQRNQWDDDRYRH